MISFQQSGELVYHEIPSTISFRNQQDLMVNLHDRVTIDGNTNLAGSNKRKRGRDHSSYKANSGIIGHGVRDNKDEHMLRKLVHKEIERERRKNITKLYASLGALLPYEFIKGKRSISDRTLQVVNYIKHIQEKIETLSVKRDQLKKLVGMSVKENIMNKVSISSCNGRIVEIEINSCSIEDGFHLSKVLEAIVEEGLHIINYTFTKRNKRLLHSVQSEACDTTLTDLSRLQQRLVSITNTWQIFT
ncbi:Myc-type, basic helix-loop-helix (bHLH) domain-containing protein [Artemisia annua]|uniref:Myc-type, basic helix-loop-helix (BHLH) domain-containing protein n=1 Tax=Artemisia annua TaxID=35608 RepID=A0A2U1QDY9_ARTAN|nr:Myc-type, basic helix-loop-helix (bHLH) domain-containing protein [Artemisia annua]